MSANRVIEACLSQPYPAALEEFGLSYTAYCAVRRQRRFPPRNNFKNRNMKMRQDIMDAVRLHPEWTYSQVAISLALPVPAVWKVFTEYLLHDAGIRKLISRARIRLM